MTPLSVSTRIVMVPDRELLEARRSTPDPALRRFRLARLRISPPPRPGLSASGFEHLKRVYD